MHIIILVTALLFTKNALPHVPAASSSTLTSEASSSNGTSSSSTSSSPLSSSSGHAIDLDLPSAPTYNEDSVSFHYYRKDGTYKNWDMWLWEVGKDGAAFAFNAKDDWGVIASYPLSKWVDPVTNSLGFIIREGGDSWSSKDCGGSDLFLDFSLYNKDANGVYNVYLVSGDSNVYVDTAGNMVLGGMSPKSLAAISSMRIAPMRLARLFLITMKRNSSAFSR